MQSPTREDAKRHTGSEFFHDHIWARTGTKISTTDRTHARTGIYTQSGTHLSRDSNDKLRCVDRGGSVSQQHL